MSWDVERVIGCVGYRPDPGIAAGLAADEPPRLEDGEQPRDGALVHAELGRQLRDAEVGPGRAERGENRKRAVGRLHGCR